MYGQEAKQHVYSGWYISLPSNDTVRTFSFGYMDLDTCKYKLAKFWGEPTHNTTGNVIWTSMEIPNIGKELNINLTDMFCAMVKNNMKCVSFKDEKDKENKLLNIKPSQSRKLELTITDKENKDIIMDKSKVEFMLQYLEKILK